MEQSKKPELAEGCAMSCASSIAQHPLAGLFHPHRPKRSVGSYVDWIRRFILFHNKRHPQDMGRAEIEAFLTHLAVEGHIAASTHLRPGVQRAALSLPRGAQD